MHHRLVKRESNRKTNGMMPTPQTLKVHLFIYSWNTVLCRNGLACVFHH